MGGIGLELASHIATRHGARVALIGRTPPDPARQARIDALNGAVAFFQADARDAASTSDGGKGYPAAASGVAKRVSPA